jgi:hypothetical protein
MGDISFTEQLKVFQNVIARVGFDNPEIVLKEYHKAISGIRGFQSFMETNPPTIAGNFPSMPQDSSQKPTISPEPYQSTTQGQPMTP